MSTQQTQRDPQRVVTGTVRLSYVHVFKPYKNPQNPNATPKYSVTLLIPKSDTATMQRINAAIEAAIQWGVQNKWNGVKPANVPVPIHDGDGLRPSGEPFTPECKGHWVMTASSENPPEIVDVNLNPIIDQTQVYSGMYGRVSIRFFAYFNSGKKGIGAALGNVQKTADGEPLSLSKVSAEQDFGADAAPWAAEQAQTQQSYYNPAPQVNRTHYNPTRQQQQPAIDPITGLPLGGIKGLG